MGLFDTLLQVVGAKNMNTKAAQPASSSANAKLITGIATVQRPSAE